MSGITDFVEQQQYFYSYKIDPQASAQALKQFEGKKTKLSGTFHTKSENAKIFPADDWGYYGFKTDSQCAIIPDNVPVTISIAQGHKDRQLIEDRISRDINTYFQVTLEIQQKQENCFFFDLLEAEEQQTHQTPGYNQQLQSNISSIQNSQHTSTPSQNVNCSIVISEISSNNLSSSRNSGISSHSQQSLQQHSQLQQFSYPSSPNLNHQLKFSPPQRMQASTLALHAPRPKLEASTSFNDNNNEQQQNTPQLNKIQSAHDLFQIRVPDHLKRQSKSISPPLQNQQQYQQQQNPVNNQDQLSDNFMFVAPPQQTQTQQIQRQHPMQLINTFQSYYPQPIRQPIPQMRPTVQNIQQQDLVNPGIPNDRSYIRQGESKDLTELLTVKVPGTQNVGTPSTQANQQQVQPQQGSSLAQFAPVGTPLGIQRNPNQIQNQNVRIPLDAQVEQQILVDQIALELGIQKKDVSLGLSRQGLQPQQSIQPTPNAPVIQSNYNSNINVPSQPTPKTTNNQNGQQIQQQQNQQQIQQSRQNYQPNQQYNKKDQIYTLQQDQIPQIPIYRNIDEIPQTEMDRLKRLHVICPITLKTMKNPQRALDGQVYEYSAITKYLDEHFLDLPSGTHCEAIDLKPDAAAFEQSFRFAQQNPNHPCVPAGYVEHIMNYQSNYYLDFNQKK